MKLDTARRESQVLLVLKVLLVKRETGADSENRVGQEMMVPLADEEGLETWERLVQKVMRGPEVTLEIGVLRVLLEFLELL